MKQLLCYILMMVVVAACSSANEPEQDADSSSGATSSTALNNYVTQAYLSPEFLREKSWDSYAIRIDKAHNRILVFDPDDDARRCYAWRWSEGSSLFTTCSGAFFVVENLGSAPSCEARLGSHAVELGKAPTIKAQFFNDDRVVLTAQCFGSPVFSWVDDDFYYDYEKYHDLCLELGISMSFALACDRNEAGEATLTDGRRDRALQYQREGFEMLLHPCQDVLAPKSGTPSQATVEAQIVAEKRLFDQLGIHHHDIMVYPAFSANFPTVVTAAKKHCVMAARGIDHGYVKEDCYYNLPHACRYNVLRIELDFKTLSKTETKALIDRAVANNGWLIFETHGYTFSSSLATDDTSNTLGNLKEIIEYAAARAPFQSLWQCYQKKCPILVLNDDAFTHANYNLP